MKVTIKEVLSKRDLKKFVRFPNIFYKDNKYYVPTLESGDMDLLDRNKNHAFEYCESKYWLALDADGKIVGRIAGIINREYNRTTGKEYARFGFLDFVDDEEVVDALFDTVEKWASVNGMQLINGPLGFLEFDASGVLVEGFDEYPTAYGKYNYPYYEKHLLRRGYVKEVDWVEYRLQAPEETPDAYIRGAEMIASKYNLHLAEIRTRVDIMKYFFKLAAVLNHAYSKIHGFTQLSQGQLEDLGKQFIPMIDPKLVAIVLDKDDNVVAFCICLPSMSKAMQKAKGRLFPFGFIHILHDLKHNDTLDTLLVGIEDEYKGKGVTAMLYGAVCREVVRRGIKYIETTRELEDNFSVQNLGRRFHPRLHKRARCYIKNL